MIYNNTIQDIESRFFEPWRMCGEFADGFIATVGGSDEESCTDVLIGLTEKHGELTWYSGYQDGDYQAGEYVGEKNFIFE